MFKLSLDGQATSWHWGISQPLRISTQPLNVQRQTFHARLIQLVRKHLLVVGHPMHYFLKGWGEQ